MSPRAGSVLTLEDRLTPEAQATSSGFWCLSKPSTTIFTPLYSHTRGSLRAKYHKVRWLSIYGSHIPSVIPGELKGPESGVAKDKWTERQNANHFYSSLLIWIVHSPWELPKAPILVPNAKPPGRLVPPKDLGWHVNVNTIKLNSIAGLFCAIQWCAQGLSPLPSHWLTLDVEKRLRLHWSCQGKHGTGTVPSY